MKRWNIPGYAWSPKERVECMLTRISRNRFLCQIKDRDLIYRVCERYSFNPNQTFNSIFDFGLGHYHNGKWNCPVWNGARFEYDRAKEDLVPYSCVRTREVVEKYPRDFGVSLQHMVSQCESCQTTEGRIYDRGDLHLHFDKTFLCTSCWNKRKIYVKNVYAYRENKTLINKLNKERLKWQKLKLQAT